MAAPPVPSGPPPRKFSRLDLFIVAEAVLFATVLAYSNTFGSPFLGNDLASIWENPTIRHLGNLGAVLSPPHQGETVGGRPLLNLSFALNYAVGGFSVYGYHLVNLVIHLLAGLTLFDVVRRTLRQPILRPGFGDDAAPLALAVAALWLLHPLQTEAVTHLSQRAESMMGLLYLVTLGAFIRAVHADRPRRWYALSIVACLLGMATKEVMATAPLLVLLYDRTFVAGTFRQAWEKRRGFYLALAATWILLAVLVVGAGSRGGTAVVGTQISWPGYIVMQFPALAEYLKLSFWPSPLIFDYGFYWVRDPRLLALSLVFVVLLVVATVSALRRRQPAGFLGAWFLLILAPTSLLPVSSETLSDHRMYLPVAAVMTLLVLAIHARYGRRGLVLVALLALVFGLLTYRRNFDYRDSLAIWGDAVAHEPGSVTGRLGLGDAFLADHRPAEALQQFDAALILAPDFPATHVDRGVALFQLGRSVEAMAEFERGLALDPGQPGAHASFAEVLGKMGRVSEAIGQDRAALQIEPGFPPAEKNLAQLQAAPRP